MHKSNSVASNHCRASDWTAAAGKKKQTKVDIYASSFHPIKERLVSIGPRIELSTAGQTADISLCLLVFRES